MVRHIVMWNFKEGFTKEQNINNANKIKLELENLVNLIDGIKSLTVETAPLPSSNRDVILNSLFENEEALNNYIVHPEHVRVGGLVRSVLKNRAAIDYHE